MFSTVSLEKVAQIQYVYHSLSVIPSMNAWSMGRAGCWYCVMLCGQKLAPNRVTCETRSSCAVYYVSSPSGNEEDYKGVLQFRIHVLYLQNAIFCTEFAVCSFIADTDFLLQRLMSCNTLQLTFIPLNKQRI
jgi:hypothetical protein